MTDKKRRKCELSACHYTAMKGMGVCFMHWIIGMQDGRYDYSWVVKKNPEGRTEIAQKETDLILSGKKSLG